MLPTSTTMAHGVKRDDYQIQDRPQNGKETVDLDLCLFAKDRASSVRRKMEEAQKSSGCMRTCRHGNEW